MKKIIIALIALMMVGCDMAWDSLDITNGSEYVIKSKTKKDQTNLYRLLEVGDSWYDYNYRDTTNFEVGDTLIIIVASVKGADKKNLKNLLNN